MGVSEELPGGPRGYPRLRKKVEAWPPDHCIHVPLGESLVETQGQRKLSPLVPAVTDNLYKVCDRNRSFVTEIEVL